MQTSQKRPGDTDPQEQPAVTRAVDIDATVEEIWDAITTDEGRDGWLEPDPERVVIVELLQPPTRIAWWWWSGEQQASHVDVRVVGLPAGARVIVTETAPASFPLAQMASSLNPVLVFA